jgi:tetratricopeptide (TPR) repeat protein
MKILNRFYSDIIGRVYDNPFICLRESGDLGNCYLPYLDVICHGDLNARNVLIEGRTEKINFIDFAHTGVGHFCCDFAKLETVIVTELFSQLPFTNKLLLVGMFADNLMLDDSVYFHFASRFKFDHTCRELFLLVKVIRDSFIDIFSMQIQSQEDLFKNYKISLIHFLLKSLGYTDVSRSDKLVAFYELGALVGSFEESLQRLHESGGQPTYAIEQIEKLSSTLVEQLNSDDLSLLTESTKLMRQHRTIGSLDYYRNMGKIKYSEGDWDGAFQDYQKLLKIAESGDHMWYLSEAFLGLGLIEHVKGKIYRGRDYFSRAKTIKEEQCHNDLEGLAEVFMRLGWGEEDVGTLHNSLKYYKKALQYARKSRMIPVVVGALYDLGVVCWKLNMIDKANNLFGEGYELAKRNEMHKNMGYHLLGLSRVSWSTDQSNAADLFKNSIDIFRAIDYKRGLAIALTEYGDFLLSQKDVENSRNAIFEARTLKQSLGEKRELYITETVLAANLLESSDLKGAMKILQDAIHGFESLDVYDSYRKRAEELLSTIAKQENLTHEVAKQVNLPHEKPIIKQVFISSTVYDLERERDFIKSFLEKYEEVVQFKCLMSEEPDFPITPSDLVSKHSYSICLDKVALADYFILLIKQRYGDSIIEDKNGFISITHREYREAFRKRIPIFTFVDQRTWNARNLFKKKKMQDFVPEKHTKVFDFIDEIARQPRNNWMYFYKNFDDVKTSIEQVLFKFDDSIFVGDVNTPNGTVLEVGEEFEKVWEIKNNGCVIWEDRFLQEENAGASGLVPFIHRIPIPRTLPGKTVRITIEFKAPKYPCTCESYWKMVDSSGKYSFPHKKGLFCRVKVVY